MSASDYNSRAAIRAQSRHPAIAPRPVPTLRVVHARRCVRATLASRWGR